eukprot:TRINITY_DN1224_c0_g1_i1.p1 TRINITY_DN1224_c0_g1~~TRINITY_DN1224_c0_g1_i1.p1  ORF type:complete len:356 (+),score=47.73 TRINITY_DN1224_c0_g1_i1:206-1273(+)
MVGLSTLWIPSAPPAFAPGDCCAQQSSTMTLSQKRRSQQDRGLRILRISSRRSYLPTSLAQASRKSDVCVDVSRSLPPQAESIPNLNESSLKEDKNDDMGASAIGERVYFDDDGNLDDGNAIKLECDESGCVLVVSKNVQRLEEEKIDNGRLVCDLSGCSYVAENSSASEEPAEFKVLEGAGWRIGYESSPASEETFAAVVGAGGWSVALTASEFNDFCKLIQMLRKGIVTMDEEGVIGKDDIVMQVERGSVFMECTVPRKRLPNLQNFWKFGGKSESSAFEIRFLLSGSDNRRQAEGYWPAEAVMDMLKKIDECTATIEPVASRPLPDPSRVNGGTASDATNLRVVIGAGEGGA